MLQNNYPNPFNPSTTINCAIKDGEVGTLTIYNARGQVVKKQSLDAGEHTLNWNGTAYGSGVYLYKLETESYTKTRKMIMIK
jgi:flagellar hook assembly protein FlgD